MLVCEVSTEESTLTDLYSTLTINVVDFALGQAEVDLPLGYMVVSIFQLTTALGSDYLVIALVYRCVEDCHEVVRGPKTKSPLQTFHFATLCILGLLSVALIAISVGETVQDFHGGSNYTLLSVDARLEVVYVAVYALMTLEALVSACIYGIRQSAPTSLQRSHFLLPATCLLLFLAFLLSLVIDAVLLTEEITATAQYACLIASTLLVGFVLLGLAFLAITPRRALINKQDGSHPPAYPNTMHDQSPEVRYQLASHTYEAEQSAAVYEAPLSTRFLELECQPSSAIYEVPNHYSGVAASRGSQGPYQAWPGSRVLKPLHSVAEVAA